jgi:hypothetical protein
MGMSRAICRAHLDRRWVALNGRRGMAAARRLLRVADQRNEIQNCVKSV